MKTTNLTREFQYQGKVIVDPNPALSPERAVAVIAATNSELANAKIEPPIVEGDKQIYRLRVAIGDKG